MAEAFDFNTVFGNPWTQTGLAMMAGSRSENRGQAFLQALMQQQQMQRQAQAQQMENQLMQQKLTSLQAQQQAGEQFRQRAPEYISSPIGEQGPMQPQFQPQQALRVGMETGAIEPMEALQMAQKTRSRYIPVGGTRLFDTQTGEYIEGPPSPVRLGQGQMLAVPDEQGQYQPGLINPRQFPPESGTPKAPKLVPTKDPTTGETVWGPQTAGAPVVEKPKTLPLTAVKDLGEAANTITELDNVATTFKPEFAGYVSEMAGQALNEVGARAGGKYGEQATWWANLKRYDNIERHPIFGATLTGNELKAWHATTSHPGMQADQIKAILAERKRILDNNMRNNVQAFEQSGYKVPKLLGPRREKAAAQTGMPPEAEAWISRAMQANPSLSREQIIEEGRRRGKLR